MTSGVQVKVGHYYGSCLRWNELPQEAVSSLSSEMSGPGVHTTQKDGTQVTPAGDRNLDQWPGGSHLTDSMVLGLA